MTRVPSFGSCVLHVDLSRHASAFERGGGLEAVAREAGVSRQAIYLHFASKAELLTALHLHIYATDVVPALERHPITDAMTALEALDATIAVDVEVASEVWRDSQGSRDGPTAAPRG
jgi:AcrR family transcriptional regulator